MTRRELIGMGSVGVAVGAVGGYLALRRADSGAPAKNYPVRHSDAEWRARLAPAAYAVLRKAGTETPYSSPLVAEQRVGLFACAGCDNPTFRSETKFDSHTGWPSFWEAIPGAVDRHADRSLAMSRTEVVCARCGGHLGHVFTDGPKPTGLRYCMNGVALSFRPTSA